MLTDSCFGYSRANVPLFFAELSPPEHQTWCDSVAVLTAEYNRHALRVSHEDLMSNGMTFGEFAMFLLTSKHRRRVRQRNQTS